MNLVRLFSQLCSSGAANTANQHLNTNTGPSPASPDAVASKSASATSPACRNPNRGDINLIDAFAVKGRAKRASERANACDYADMRSHRIAVMEEGEER